MVSALIAAHRDADVVLVEPRHFGAHLVAFVVLGDVDRYLRIGHLVEFISFSDINTMRQAVQTAAEVDQIDEIGRRRSADQMDQCKDAYSLISA